MLAPLPHLRLQMSVTEKRNMEVQTSVSMQAMSDLIKENEALKQRLVCLEQNFSAANEKVVELENKPADLATITKEMDMQTKKNREVIYRVCVRSHVLCVLAADAVSVGTVRRVP